MKRFIEGESRTQVTLLPECLADYVAEENPVRVVDVSSMNSTWVHLGLKALILLQRAVRPTIRQAC